MSNKFSIQDLKRLYLESDYNLAENFLKTYLPELTIKSGFWQKIIKIWNEEKTNK